MPHDNTLLPCLPAVAISNNKELKFHLQQLKQLVSAPPDIYAELYETTLNRYIEFCQTQPFSMEQAEPFGLLKNQLNLAIAALKLKRGVMLPFHSESETIAEQEPLWTYAIFAVSLFAQIHLLQCDRSIELYKNGGDKLGAWHPLAGNLFEQDTFYNINQDTAAIIIEAELLRAVLIGRIIPSTALRWLTSCPAVFDVWWPTMIEDFATKNILSNLIAQAAESINYPIKELLSRNKPLENLIDRFFGWLEVYVKNNQPTKSHDKLLRVKSGLFVSLTLLDEFILEGPQIVSKENLLEKLADILIKNANGVTHRYRSVHFEKRHILEGILISEQHLSGILAEQLIQSDFIPDIPL